MMQDRQLDILDFDVFISEILGKEFPSKEYFEIEYKSAQGGFPKEFWKTYSAFGNTNAGVIILGVTEKKGSFIIEGLTEEQSEKYKKQFWDDCNNPNTVSRNLLQNSDIKVLDVHNKKVLVFRIPFATRTERPIYLTRNPFGNTYKRNHEGDYRCTDEEVKRMLADSSAELHKDSLILEHYSLPDLDTTTLKQFRQLFISSRPGHPWHALDDIELLKKIGAYRIDRKTGIKGLTLAGMLMFGKEESIKEIEEIPNYFPEFRERLSTDKKVRWTNRIYPDGSWECNLLQFFLRVWPQLSSTLPIPFALSNDERKDETPMHIALREAFVNAIVHADYSLNGNIIIELTKEEFTFSNPGTLLISIQQYYAGGISECRNPSLQQMFMLIGRAEKAGSGVDKIMEGWLESHWRKPFLQLYSQPDRVKLILPMFNIIPESILGELKILFDDIDMLTQDELTVLAFCLIEGSISNYRLQFILNMHSSDITVLLKKLCNDGYLESDNNGRWTIYNINRKVDTSGRKVDTSGRKVDTSGRKVDTSDGRKVDTSGRKVDTSDDRKVDTYGEKNRLNKEDLEKQIMLVCKDNYMKMEDVAKTLGKSVDYLKNKIFPKMIKEDKLQKRFPFTHNHPEQGYKTTEHYAKQL